MLMRTCGLGGEKAQRQELAVAADDSIATHKPASHSSGVYSQTRGPAPIPPSPAAVSGRWSTQTRGS